MSPSLAKDPLVSAAEISLVALAMSGDDTAFEELVRRRQGGIRGLMGQLSGDWSLADDLSQEAFLRAWRKIRTLRSPGAFGGWLRRIAVNVFLQHIRRAGAAIQNSDEVVPYPVVDDGDASIKMDLEKALARLKPIERLCIVLSYSQRMSHGEICTATGLPLGTVKSHISRGSTRLREYLKDYEGDVR
ncbi:MAG: sigma-70 family RNA polymerase sigma factor [Desulfobacterales bacterium]